jgi:hypothetical protein
MIVIFKFLRLILIATFWLSILWLLFNVGMGLLLSETINFQWEFLLIPVVSFLILNTVQNYIDSSNETKLSEQRLLQEQEQLEADMKEEKKLIKKEQILITECLQMIKDNEASINLLMSKLKKIRRHKWPESEKIYEWIESKQASNRQEKERKKIEEQKKIDNAAKELCSDETQWKSYLNKKLSLGMHLDVVKIICGEAHDKKVNVSKNQEVIKYKYLPFKNSRGNTNYKLEVTYTDNRVTSFKDI